MLPAGRLREPAKGKDRADIIVVSKCPTDISEEERKQITAELAPSHTQQLYFSTFTYGRIQPLFTQGAERELSDIRADEHSAGNRHSIAAATYRKVKATNSAYHTAYFCRPSRLYRSRYEPDSRHIPWFAQREETDSHHRERRGTPGRTPTYGRAYKAVYIRSARNGKIYRERRIIQLKYHQLCQK